MEKGFKMTKNQFRFLKTLYEHTTDWIPLSQAVGLDLFLLYTSPFTFFKTIMQKRFILVENSKPRPNMHHNSVKMFLDEDRNIRINPKLIPFIKDVGECIDELMAEKISFDFKDVEILRKKSPKLAEAIFILLRKGTNHIKKEDRDLIVKFSKTPIKKIEDQIAYLNSKIRLIRIFKDVSFKKDKIFINNPFIIKREEND